MTDAIEGVVDTLYEMRLETLLSVEDLVTAVVNALEVNHNSSIYAHSQLRLIFMVSRLVTQLRYVSCATQG